MTRFQQFDRYERPGFIDPGGIRAVFVNPDNVLYLEEAGLTPRQTTIYFVGSSADAGPVNVTVIGHGMVVAQELGGHFDE